MSARGGSAHRLRGRAGQERRERWLRLHPLCARCLLKRKVSAATIVDHIIALTNGGADDETNLQSLCKPCHDRKTREDLGLSEQFARDENGWLIPSCGQRNSLANPAAKKHPES